jgi:hypothetical protein
MPNKVVVYVYGTALAAILALVGSYAVSPTAAAGWLTPALCMAALGMIAQVLAHKVGSKARGSIASIPYMAGVLLVPSWHLVLCILLAEVVVIALRRMTWIKAVFNVSQFTVSVASSVIAYRVLGGTAIVADGTLRILPYAAAVALFFALNTFAVCGVVALSENSKFSQVWRRMTRGALLYDILASPLAFLFAWVFATRGIAGAVLLAIPLLAVRQVYRTSWQLEQATQDLLQLMVKAIEARDPYTSGHSQRVQEYSMLIGRIAGLSARVCDRLGTAALLHDVGKIHEIYAPILRKPDKLTAEEWEIMKTHPVKSAELVATVSQLHDLVPTIRNHHENWDGSGYPDHLAGAAIPYWARIITIADTIDAMTTDRPYRTALSVETVRTEIASMAGRQFDPSICVALLNSRFFDKLEEQLSPSLRSGSNLRLEPKRSRYSA